MNAAFAALLAEYDALIAEELRAAESMLIVAGKDPDEIDSTLAAVREVNAEVRSEFVFLFRTGGESPDMLRTITETRRRFETTAESIRTGTLVNVTDGEQQEVK